jgi:apolipoprotein D and lipocalin family protein
MGLSSKKLLVTDSVGCEGVQARKRNMKVDGLSMFLFCMATAANAQAPLEVVGSVDLDRYLGKWYEVASYPAWFAKNCTAVTAEYSLREDAGIRVVNRCRKGSLDGKLKEAKGRAKVVDSQTNARLKVSFFGPFWGDYWIVDLDPDYRWAVVGEPKRKYLWILSRTPTLDKDTLEGILSRLPEKGYDIERLQWTPQMETGEEQ